MVEKAVVVGTRVLVGGDGFRLEILGMDEIHEMTP